MKIKNLNSVLLLIGSLPPLINYTNDKIKLNKIKSAKVNNKTEFTIYRIEGFAMKMHNSMNLRLKANCTDVMKNLT